MKTSLRMFCMVLFLIMPTVYGKAQDKTDDGVVLSVEDGLVYVDLGSSEISSGDVLSVFNDKGTCIGQIVAESTYGTYSSARPCQGVNINSIANGMVVSAKPVISNTPIGQSINIQNSLSQTNSMDSQVNDGRYSVIIPPAQVNDVVGVGYFGGYVADLLMEQLMMCPNVKLIDRSIFDSQVAESDMAGAYIDSETAIEKGRIAGARYAVVVTMQKPDVTNVTTGIPLASIMGSLQSGMNRNLGAQYMSNVQVSRLKAAVSLSVRVVDIQTGEVLFMTSGNGKAEGDAQVGLEYGALGGAKLNGGASGFKQTVTGKAIQKAFMTVGRHLDKYFRGETTSKVMGSASGYGRFDEKLDRRGMSLYSGVNKLSNDDIYSMFYDRKDLYFSYKSAKKRLRWSNICNVIGVLCLGGAAVGLITDSGDPDSELGAYVAGIAGTGLVTTGIIMNISAHRKVEKIKDEYNRAMSPRAMNDINYKLDIVSAQGGGIGLRLSF